MAMNDVKLIGARHCPFVLRARIALNVKSVEYELLDETSETKSEPLLKSNPVHKEIPVLIRELLLKSNPVHKKIPVLIHNDKPICESLIIVEYINEAWASGPSILPSDLYDRTIARLWVAYIDEKSTQHRCLLCMEDEQVYTFMWIPALKDMHVATDKTTVKTAAGQVEEGLGLLEEEFQKISEGKSFFGGDHIGYLDIAIGGLLEWLRRTEGTDGVKLINETKTPGFLKWADKFAADPAVKDVFPDIEASWVFLKPN